MQALIGQELSDLERLLAERGHPRYRARQLYHGLYQQGAPALEELSTLPKALRAELSREFAPGLPRVAQRTPATDGTVRYLLALADGKTIEAVFLPEEGHDTLCISTQVGCPVDCKFCLTALMGLERNLAAGEIVGQVLALCREHCLDPRSRQLNVVMMGMGEPLLNLRAVSKATRLLCDPDGVGMPPRRITVSTSGITPKIEEFGREPVRGKLAISLNASYGKQRRRIMPITARFPLEELLEACRRYPLRPWERLTFEYVLLRGVNDTAADALRVVSLLGALRAKVNLIAFNPGPGIDYETPERGRVLEFQRIVRRGLPCFIRKPRGREIYAACGQLKRTVEVTGEKAS